MVVELRMQLPSLAENFKEAELAIRAGGILKCCDAVPQNVGFHLQMWQGYSVGWISSRKHRCNRCACLCGSPPDLQLRQPINAILNRIALSQSVQVSKA